MTSGSGRMLDLNKEKVCFEWRKRLNCRFVKRVKSKEWHTTIKAVQGYVKGATE